jgi:pimeloyl-ACP methyl ester carboxylesterase
MADVQLDGVRLNVQRLGADGPPVVFLHGLVLDNLSSFYYTLAGPLAQGGADVLLYDQRGHGRSQRPCTGYDTATAVADLAALLTHVGIERPVHLVGNSFGAAIGLHAALTRPELVAGLVLIEAHCTDDWMIENMANTLTVAALGLAADRTARRFTDLRARKVLRMAATADALLNGTTLIEDVAATTPLTAAELAAVRCPVLLVYGERSELAPAGNRIAGHLRRSRLWTLPGLTHAVLREATAELNAALYGWLRDQEAFR